MNKLLIIEDDVTIRNALRILLENQGYTVVEATNGEEGLELFDKTFDLLIIAKYFRHRCMPQNQGKIICSDSLFDSQIS